MGCWDIQVQRLICFKVRYFRGVRYSVVSNVISSNINFTSTTKYNIDLLLKFFKVLYLDLNIVRDVISYVFSKG
jgi:hypothetical protein